MGLRGRNVLKFTGVIFDFHDKEVIEMATDNLQKIIELGH